MIVVRKKEIVVGLDIGTTKICALIGEIDQSGEVAIIGVGVCPSEGIKKGVVIDIDSTARAIDEAVDKAGVQANTEVEAVYVGVTGDHIACWNSKGVLPISDILREITHKDVAMVIEKARSVTLAPDRQLLHAIPIGFRVDGQDGIAEPAGMSGSELQVDMHIVHGATTFLNNVVKCVTKAELQVVELVLEPLASGEAVLLAQEKESGVCLIDIGGGTTDLAVFKDGKIFHSAVIPVGGHHVTNDIATGLKIDRVQAEKIKIDSGCAIIDAETEKEVLIITQLGKDESRKMRRRALMQIIAPRIAELFELIRDELKFAECQDKIPFGLVISGGGSQLCKITEAANAVINLPVRIGKPQILGGLGSSLSSPVYATAVGLIKYAADQRAASRLNESQIKVVRKGWLSRLLKRFNELFGG